MRCEMPAAMLPSFPVLCPVQSCSLPLQFCHPPAMPALLLTASLPFRCPSTTHPLRTMAALACAPSCQSQHAITDHPSVPSSLAAPLRPIYCGVTEPQSNQIGSSSCSSYISGEGSEAQEKKEYRQNSRAPKKASLDRRGRSTAAEAGPCAEFKEDRMFAKRIRTGAAARQPGGLSRRRPMMGASSTRGR